MQTNVPAALQGHLNADEQRMVDMLKKRLELHDEIYNSRLKREQKAKQRSGLIKRYIGKLYVVIL